MRALCSYSWPGNVGQLESRIEKTVILADDELFDRQHFPELELPAPVLPVAPACSPSTGLTLAELERRYIVQTLARMSGNRTQTAKALGMGVRGLQYKLRGCGLNDHDSTERADAAGM
jgi:DNA-binding NtrC family response regulator